MLKLAFVFPGQGSQYVGMGKALAEQFAVAREVFTRADEALGYKLSTVCFEGPAGELDRTEVTQPAILAASIAAFEVLTTEGVTPQVAAGLSLGEYSALVASGALDFETALKLVAKRGQIMQEAVPEGKGMMAAVLGLEAEMVETACAKASKFGIVSVANYNCPGQLVISGEKEAVEGAIELLRTGGGRVVPLAVSVPSHSPLMKEAADRLRQELIHITWASPAFPVVANAGAREVAADQLTESLVRQLYSPVQWEQSVEYMAGKVDYFIEVGPGKVLSALVKKIVKGRWLGNVEDPVSLQKVLVKVKEAENG